MNTSSLKISCTAAFRASLAFCALSMACGNAYAEKIHVSTPSTSLVLDGEKGGALNFLYYGAALNPSEIEALDNAGMKKMSAFPFYGNFPEHESAMAVVHENGDMILDMAMEDVSTTQKDGANITTVTMRDKVHPLTVKLNYKTYPDADVIEAWTETINGEKGTVTLNQYNSGYLPIRRNDAWLSSLYGSWANEANVETEPLTHGMKVIKNKDGGRNSHTAHGEVMISLDGKPRENEGRVIGAALAYTGNYKLRIDTDESDYHQLFAGINEENSAYHLKKGETFTTPVLALTYSDDGLSGASRNFHKWGREHVIHNGKELRKILLNSWEGVYFDINEGEWPI